MDQNLPAKTGDTGLIPGLERFLMQRSSWAHRLQLLKPECLEPVLSNRRSHCKEKPGATPRENSSGKAHQTASRWLTQSRVCLQCRRPGFSPWVRKISWGGKWQPAPVFLPAESHGQKSLASPSPWGCKELDTSEQLTQLTEWLIRENSSNEDPEQT